MSTKDPKIAKFTGTSDGLQIEPFLSIFNRYFQSMEDDLKILKLGEYLSGDALNFFGTDIVTDPLITWPQVSDRLISRYGHSDVQPLTAAIKRKLQKSESVKDYYDDKCRTLRRKRQ